MAHSIQDCIDLKKCYVVGVTAISTRRLLGQDRQDLPATRHCARCIGRSLNICRALDHLQLPELVALGGQRHWRKRDILFRAGDPITNFFKITKGVVAVSQSLDDGRRQILALRVAGDCVGYLHTDGHYTFEGHALTDVTACTFNRRRFDDLVGLHPALAAATAETLANTLKQASNSISALGQLRSTERVAYFFAELHALYEARFGTMNTIGLNMNRSEVADHLGLTLETVSRSIGKLRKRGIIEVPDGNEVTILNLEELRLLGKFGKNHPR